MKKFFNFIAYMNYAWRLNHALFAEKTVFWHWKEMVEIAHFEIFVKDKVENAA